jgi:hypothetical protein
LFFPSESVTEAIARIYALTGRPPDASRGEKRALVALRDALDLDVDLARTNSVLGKALADALEVEWLPERFTERNKITLDGLNALLEGAAEARRRGPQRLRLGRLSACPLQDRSGHSHCRPDERPQRVARTRQQGAQVRPTEPGRWAVPRRPPHQQVKQDETRRLLGGGP